MLIIRIIDKWFEKILIAICGSIMVVCLSYTALIRYFISSPFFVKLSPLAEEAAVFGFVGMLYFGAALAAREKQHFRVSAQFKLLPKSWYSRRFLVGDIMWLTFNVFIVWQGVILVLRTMERPEPSLALKIPMEFIYAIIPISFALTAFRIIQAYFTSKSDPEDVN